jgi:hypothetical protein
MVLSGDEHFALRAGILKHEGKSIRYGFFEDRKSKAIALFSSSRAVRRNQHALNRLHQLPAFFERHRSHHLIQNSLAAIKGIDSNPGMSLLWSRDQHRIDIISLRADCASTC